MDVPLSVRPSSSQTDDRGVIQLFNVGAEYMLGYSAGDAVNKITPADISEPGELIARARALSMEFDTFIKPGFEALVFKASRGIEDVYELTHIRKDSSMFPAGLDLLSPSTSQNRWADPSVWKALSGWGALFGAI